MIGIASINFIFVVNISQPPVLLQYSNKYALLPPQQHFRFRFHMGTFRPFNEIVLKCHMGIKCKKPGNKSARQKDRSGELRPISDSLIISMYF